MDNFKNDPELEWILSVVRAKHPPENMMKDYGAGVHSKIEAHKQWLAFAVPISLVIVSMSAVMILMVVLGHVHHESTMRHASAVQSISPSRIAPKQKDTVPEHASAVSAAEVSREIKILQALGEDPTDAITETMDADQLAKEMSYWDEVALHSYKQPASSVTAGKF